MKQFDCGQCAESTKKQRNCQDNGFDNIKIKKSVDEFGTKVSFCPGKATWHNEVIDLFHECHVAYLTGILPRSGGLEHQDSKFSEVFPIFIEKWENRKYLKVWSDVNDFTAKVFEAISKMFGGK